MSLFLDILRCFCCCCDDDPDYGRNYREISRHSSTNRQNESDTSAVTPLLYYDHYHKAKQSSLENISKASLGSKTLSPLHHSNKPHSSPVISKPASQPVASFSSHFTPSTYSSSSSTSLATLRLQTKSNLPSPSPVSSGLTHSSGNHLVSSSKLPAPTPKREPEPPPTSNPTLRPASSSKTTEQEYILDANSSSLPLYLVPKDVEDLIKTDIVPQVLRKSLSPLTYKSYFAALLHAEDFYCKKWAKYKMKNVSLEIQQITIHKRTNKKTEFNGHEKIIKTFVAIEIDSVPERRPFLLSRDLVHARLCDRNLEPFQGFVYRISTGNGALENRNVLLVDFGKDFYSQHCGTNKYDISFTFNRVCLKRAHQAIEEASDSLFHNFLFPESKPRKVNHYNRVTVHSGHQQLDLDQKNAVRHISQSHGSPPYLIIKGLPCRLSARMAAVVEGAVFHIYSTSLHCRILICAPRNITCDELLISLKKVIPESSMFRATAAFRERDEVPDDILPLCDYDENSECFACPPLDELCEYKIIFSTFMSSFRLHTKGLPAGHFSHIFLLDASAAIEPEVLVPLTKFAIDATTVIVIGDAGNQPYWVRSTIARRHGLKKSYFERLNERMPYRNHDPLFVSEVRGR